MISVGADVLAETRGPTVVTLGTAALVSVAAWAATAIMRSGAWTTVTVGRAVVDGIWVATATAPAWWALTIAPVIDHRDRLGTGPLTALIVLSTLAVMLTADLVVTLPRLEPAPGRAMAVLATGALVYLAAGQLVAWEHLADVEPERGLAAVVLAGIPVVAVLATREPALSRLVTAVREIRELQFWAITVLPLLATVPVVARTGAPTAWTLASLGVLGVRAGLVVRENRQLLDAFEAQSRRDPLTGLDNRRTLDDADLTGRPIGACYIDLDGFKPVNDRHGHRVGDEVLRIIAQRLRSCVRPSDMVLRVGGDEFVLLLVDASDPTRIRATATRALARIEEPIVIDGTEHHLSASLGTAHTARWDDPDELLGHADGAMYRAKRRGGRQVLAA